MPLKKSKKESERINIAGVSLSHPNKIMKPTKNITKIGLAEYYDFISDKILPHLRNRPIVLVRCPTAGTEGKDCFFQKHYNKFFPKAIKPIDVGKSGDYMMIVNKSGLLALVQFDTLELHPWGSKLKSLELPDRITFDLDPAPGVSWQDVIDAAVILRRELTKLGLKTYIKTSGGKGLHLFIPIRPKYNWDIVKSFTEAFARLMTAKYPDRFIATLSKAKRQGKIFVDYLRNSKDATAVAAYSTRAKIGAPISMPISWRELKTLKSAQQYTISNVRERLKKLKKDPWADFFKCSQQIPIDFRE